MKPVWNQTGYPVGQRALLQDQGQNIVDHRKQDHGFTLFELIISITILSVILVLVFGALRLGVRAWDRGERDLSRVQEKRVVLDLIKQQLASFHRVSQATQAGEENDPAFTLLGTDRQLELISSRAIVPGNNYGPVYVRYVVETDADGFELLKVYEKSIVLVTMEEGSVPDPDPDFFIPLVTGMKHIGFEYMSAAAGEDQDSWQTAWTREEASGFPAAVKITLTDNRSGEETSIVARLRIDNEEE